MDGFARRSWLNALRENKVTDTAKESSHGNASLGSREKIRATDTDTHTAMELHQWAAVKSPLGAQTVLGDRHDLIYEILLQEPSAACGTRPRELSNGWAPKQIRATDTETHTAMELHHWAAVKSPLGAQIVLGDRHDLVERSLITSAVARLRNSPERTFQRLSTQKDSSHRYRYSYSHGVTSVGSREKSSRGSDSPRRPTRSG